MGDKNIRLLTPGDKYSPTGLALLLGGDSEIHGAEKVSIDRLLLMVSEVYLRIIS
jgi:hypothetical protein